LAILHRASIVTAIDTITFTHTISQEQSQFFVDEAHLWENAPTENAQHRALVCRLGVAAHIEYQYDSRFTLIF
jgi:hypothetical protein